MYESQFEEDLYQQRRDKLAEIAELGQRSGLTYAEATYPNSYAFTHTIPQLREAYDALTPEQLEAGLAAGKKIEVSIAGRIMAIRVQGKAGFAQLQQAGERFQIYVRKDDVGENLFALYKLLDLGDHIGVRGYLFRTRTGELTVHVSQVALPEHQGQPALTFLAKAMLALPDKYHGLEDTELRYRQRYVDLFMNTGTTKPATTPNAPTNPGTPTNPGAPGLALADLGEAPQTSPEISETPNVREVFVKRAAILRAIRRFFDDRDYLEVETPMMHQVAGGAAAQPFTTHHNALDLDLFLRIAPELYLKRLVVGGLDRVYEINRNFRNEGISTRHNPEFTMLEFYQAYANYQDLMDLTEELIIFVAKEVNGSLTITFNDNKIDLSKWTRLSMRESIVKWWPHEFGGAPETEHFADRELFTKLLLKILEVSHSVMSSYHFDPSAPIGTQLLTPIQSSMTSMNGKLKDLWHEHVMKKAPLGRSISSLFEIVAEPRLIQPTIIYDFPLAVSPLSKKKPDEPDWVERFEFYIGGFEIGNAFSELNDPDDQRARFEQQMTEKERGDDEAHRMDEDYVRALGYGLPPTAGEGIGIDRLTMLLTNSRSIRDVILFPLLRPHSPERNTLGGPSFTASS